MLAPALSSCVFLASATLGLALSRGTDGVAALWPANAVLLSALILSDRAGRRWHLAACAVAGLFANLIGGTGLLLSAVFALANVVACAVAFRSLGERRGAGRMFEDPAFVVRFVAAIAAGVAAGATLAASALWWMSDSFVASWLSWAASDLLGMLLVTPLAVTALGRARAPRDGERRAMAGWRLWPLAVLLVISLVVFEQSRFPLLFVPLAVVMIATYRLGLLGAVAGTLIVAAVGSALMATGNGPIALVAGSMALRIRFFQFYLATLYATSMPLAALLAERARLARERAESDRRHRRILDRSREVVFETDLAGRWTYLNPAWQALTGRPVAEGVGGSLLDILLAEDRGRALECLEPLYRQQLQQCHLDLRCVHVDGRVLWAAVRSHLLVDEHGAVVGTYGTIHDVTARMESERLYRLLADNSNDMIVHFDINGMRQYVSPASQALLGFAPDELTGQAAAGAIHPDDRATVVATCRTLLEGAENPICSYRQLHKDGHYVWLEASYRLIRGEATGLPDGFIASVRDIGRRTEAELERTEAAARLEEANRLLLMAEEMSAVGHWRVDVASGTAFWSDTVCAIHGQPAGYTPPMETAIEAYHPDDRAAVEAAVAEALASGRSYAMRARIVRTDGAIRHVMLTGRAEMGPDGSVTGMFGVFQDVTDAHEAQQALLVASDRVASSNRLLTMAEAVAHLGHWRVEMGSRSYFWSDEVYRICGLGHDFQPGFDNTIALYHPDDRARIVDTVGAAMAAGSGYSFRARLVRPDGGIAHVFVRGEIDRDEAGLPVGRFGILQDVSEQAEVEERLRAGEARFRLITEQASDIIAIMDLDGRCVFMSPASQAVLGRAPEAMVGACFHDFSPAEDHPAIDRLGAQILGNSPDQVSTSRFRMRHADGGLRWIEATARLATHDGRPCVIEVARDVTGNVRTEDALREARVQAEAAATAKSSFLANMSHEIRTPMNGVVGFAELLLAGDLDPEQRRQAELIADSSRAMMRLLNDILDLSKVEAGQMTVASEPFDLVHALKACIRLVTPAVEQKRLAMHCDFAADLPAMVTGDALRVRQIVLNLLGNAAKFTLEGSIALSARIEDDGRLAIAVTDTGIGIAPDRQQAIFEQFVQADSGVAARFGGTGLGLSISNRLAMLMGGTLTLDSEPGRGTRFTLHLPIGAAASQAPDRRAAATGPGGASLRDGNVRLLVAEDHDVNQLLISAMLEKLGCRPDLANDGDEAIAMVKAAAAAGRPYSLVFMDMQMPGLDGVEATRRLRASGVGETQLPIVALTANAYPDDIETCLAAGMQAHVAKPFSLETLEAALRRWLPATPVAEPQGGARFSAKIQDRYRARRTETLERLDELIRTGTFTEVELEEVATMLHKLAGTAEMFGDVTLGVEAKLLETGLAAWPEAERQERIVRGVRAMQRAA